MKVNQASASLAELVERMEATEAPAAVDEEMAGVEDRGALDVGMAPSAPSGDADRLETRLGETARRALAGEFDSLDQVRGEVVDAVIEERYSESLEEAGATDVASTVRAALQSDPNVCRQVDHLLVAAAASLKR